MESNAIFNTVATVFIASSIPGGKIRLYPHLVVVEIVDTEILWDFMDGHYALIPHGYPESLVVCTFLNRFQKAD